MAVSISNLGYKKLSQMIFEWQAADRTSLMALFIVMEVALHWLWCFFVWWQQDVLYNYINMHYLYPLWLGVSVVGLFFLCMVKCLFHSKSNEALDKWQIVLITIYTLYIATVIVMIGYSSLFAGVSVVGGAMLGMMLIKRRNAWRMFWLQLILMLLAIMLPYFGVSLPNLRQLTIIHPMLDGQNYLTYNEIIAAENMVSALAFENNVLNWDDINEVQRSSAFFWRSTHLFLALPKAIFIVYMFRALLLILDDSRQETIRHANQDELTQLKNRRYGLKKMKYALSQIKENQDLSIILLDLDWFKSINDNYGHEMGDQVLVEISQTLAQSFSDETIITRYGGEEFLIVLPNTKHDSAMVIAEQLRSSIAEQVINVEGVIDFNVTASFGLYTLTYEERACIAQKYKTILKERAVSESGSLPIIKPIVAYRAESHLSSMQKMPSDICQRLISTADKALYEAKHRGRNQVVSANKMFAEQDDCAHSLYRS
ncbi:GGDEF domain-containing protein [Psychrobacter proteolyticus]|jgi:diguanylate cyclase (GGDEF)-like protein|uniref:GGDEF domain-containing protein n=1 Tax=Psychrobacter proteolyticus TaxID=147825 RepID=UPI000E0CA3F5|nr:GGDEF domain-containing protein [Psychrobacter proteolyticus]